MPWYLSSSNATLAPVIGFSLYWLDRMISGSACGAASECVGVTCVIVIGVIGVIGVICVGAVGVIGVIGVICVIAVGVISLVSYV